MIVFSFSVQRKNESVVECRTLELTSSRFRHRLAAETRHKSHDGNLLPSLYLCFLLSGTIYTSISLFTLYRRNSLHTACSSGYIMETEGFFQQTLVTEEAFRLSDHGQARSFWQCAK